MQQRPPRARQGQQVHLGLVKVNKNRIEALSDGVFAIAMTLLVLNIQPPDGDGWVTKLLGLWPGLLTYVLSFALAGVYWVSQHFQFQYIKQVNRPLLWINLLYLLLIGFIPFSTALLSRHWQDKLAIIIYGCHLIAIGIVVYGHWWYVTSSKLLASEQVTPHLVRSAKVRIIISPLICLVAIAISFFNPLISLLCYAVIPIVYIIPSQVDWHWTGRQQPPTSTKSSQAEEESASLIEE
ncbi:DUF1211 domain-containing protein [Ktedonosporobacter rubrisoli]|uniref:DUF1211 domain-containing protein n=1 Tax=Ktedonosporobacter rubrisoli TaxID=2509675 RepID=A0A4P6K0H0_KTERU|nr:TMEM175 family protein [Ktedonosporobacter rubrisoli]QBD81272.1 DUF1211 domain-containing protein [Ktedonosporobacter rubrisoli]